MILALAHDRKIGPRARTLNTRIPGLAESISTQLRLVPVAFTAGGRQFIAVTTGLGGGSPRQVPRAIIPEVHHPNTGHAVYVFELPERK